MPLIKSLDRHAQRSVGSLFLVILSLLLLAPPSASAAVLRKKSGRAIIMGFSKTELENYSVGQYILIENFEKNQWTGLIKKIYRVNRIRITLIEDDSEDMEVGEVFRIKPSEAPRSNARPEFDPSEYPTTNEGPAKAEDPSLLPAPDVKAPLPPVPAEKSSEGPNDQDRLLLSGGFVTRYYIVPAGQSEGDLHGTGTQLQGTFSLQNGFGASLGIRKEDLVYTGVNQFSDYSVSLIVYFAGVSYTHHFSHWSVMGGLRQNLQAKGNGSLDDVFPGDYGQPVSVSVRGIGQLQETAALVAATYDWEYLSLFVEGTLSLVSRVSTQYRWQLRAQDPQGNDLFQDYRTSSSFKTQVEGLTIGLALSL